MCVYVCVHDTCAYVCMCVMHVCELYIEECVIVMVFLPVRYIVS